MQQGLHVYTQKPLTQTIYEARQLTRVAVEKKLVTQMGIQIHSHEVHRTIVATIQAGTIGKVKEVHSWSGKHWGDKKPRPSRVDKVPKDLELELLAGRRRRAPVPGPLLSPGRVAQAARFRHRHVRRHGMPHPRPRLHIARSDRPHFDPVRWGSAQRR